VGVLDEVVLTLGAAGVAREPATLAQPVERAGPPGDDLVDVALVPGVEQQRVARGVEDPVQGQGEFDDTQVRTEVPTGAADRVDQEAADLGGERHDVLGGQRPQVGRGADTLEQTHAAQSTENPDRCRAPRIAHTVRGRRAT
jgi:hypothetical protein